MITPLNKPKTKVKTRRKRKKGKFWSKIKNLGLKLRTLWRKAHAYHGKSAAPFFIALLGNVGPLGLLLLLFLARRDNPIKWEDLYIEGQFYLVSASVLTTAAYLLYPHKKTFLQKFSHGFAITLIVISSVLYVLIYSGDNKDSSFLLLSSVLILITACLVFYYSTYLDKADEQKFDVIAQHKDEVQNMIDELGK